jgi:hypothetical protein
MGKFSSSSRLGVSFLSSATALYPLGMTINAYDDVSQTEGEYVYCQFSAITTEGQVVEIDQTNKCALTSSASANHGTPVGFAVTAFAANEYGFVQVCGKAKVKCNGAVVAGAKVMLTATPGNVDDAVIAGSQVSGAEFDTADGTPAANFAYATISHPRIQTQIT